MSIWAKAEKFGGQKEKEAARDVSFSRYAGGGRWEGKMGWYFRLEIRDAFLAVARSEGIRQPRLSRQCRLFLE